MQFPRCLTSTFLLVYVFWTFPFPFCLHTITQGNNLSLPGCKYLGGRRRIFAQSSKGIIYHYQLVSIYKQRRERGKRLIKEEIKSAMRIAVEKGHAGAGAILAKKGADCTEKEKAELGQRYTNFILSFPEEEGGESEEDGFEEEEGEYEEEENEDAKGKGNG